MANEVLRDVAEIVMGQSPPGETCNTIGSGLPLLNGPTEFGPHHPVPTQFTSDVRKRALRGDLLFCVRGSTTGRMNWADREYAIGRGLAALRHRADLKLQPLVRATIELELAGLLGEATGSTFSNVSATQIGNLPWPQLGGPDEQAVASILGALDDKIDLNRRMSDMLEATARTIFKGGFVDGGPASPARRRAGRVEPLSKHLEEPTRGVSYDGASIAAGGVPFHNLNSVFEGGGYKFEGIKNYAGEFDDRRAVQPGDVIVANTEQGHGRLLLGCAALVPRRYGSRTPYSHHLYRVRVRDGSPLRPIYVLHLLNEPWMHDLVSRYGNGTTVNMLPADALELPEMTVPDAETVGKFEEIVLPLHHRVEAAVLESETLAAIRDVLLPRLLSGEIRVPVAERLVEART